MNETELNKIENNNGSNFAEMTPNGMSGDFNYGSQNQPDIPVTNNFNQSINSQSVYENTPYNNNINLQNENTPYNNNMNISNENTQYNNNMNIPNENVNNVQYTNNFENQKSFNVNSNTFENINNVQSPNNNFNDEMIPTMIANPNAEVSSINFNQINEPSNEEIPYVEETVTQEDLELERRNKSGLRATVIFGIIILIFIILLPFLYDLL